MIRKLENINDGVPVFAISEMGFGRKRWAVWEDKADVENGEPLASGFALTAGVAKRCIVAAAAGAQQIGKQHLESAPTDERSVKWEAFGELPRPPSVAKGNVIDMITWLRRRVARQSELG